MFFKLRANIFGAYLRVGFRLSRIVERGTPEHPLLFGVARSLND